MMQTNAIGRGPREHFGQGVAGVAADATDGMRDGDVNGGVKARDCADLLRDAGGQPVSNRTIGQLERFDVDPDSVDDPRHRRGKRGRNVASQVGLDDHRGIGIAGGLEATSGTVEKVAVAVQVQCQAGAGADVDQDDLAAVAARRS